MHEKKKNLVLQDTAPPCYRYSMSPNLKRTRGRPALPPTQRRRSLTIRLSPAAAARIAKVPNKSRHLERLVMEAANG
jgi:hypothetical protein